MQITRICNFTLCNFMYIIDLHVHLLLMQICGSTSTSHFCSLFEIYCVTDIYFLWDVKWVQLL